MNNEEMPSSQDGLKKELKRKKKKNNFRWPLIALVTTLCLSFTFGFGSQYILGDTSLTISIILLIFFVALAVISDMIGVAATSAEIEPFNAMSSKKVQGAKQGLMLIRNAEKVSSVFCDIIGDICGILSGTVGATITFQILGKSAVSVQEVIVASVVSACIAALTVFLKAVFKKVAIKNSNSIIFTLGKILNFFRIKR